MELMQGGHCFNAPLAATCTNSSGSTSFTAVSPVLTGVSIGMQVTSATLPTNTVVLAITGSNAFTASAASTGATSAITFNGDVFKMALIKATSVATYGAANTNYAEITSASDEASGTGYSAGGLALTNVTPVLTGTSTAIVSFANPTWTTATFSTIGCMIYNAGNLVNGVNGASITSTRSGGASQTGTVTTGLNRACGVFDFGGTQTVSAGNFTVVMPPTTSAAALLRIS
jgi:hypothetical protein